MVQRETWVKYGRVIENIANNKPSYGVITYRGFQLLDQEEVLSGNDIYATSMDSHSSLVDKSENIGETELF